MAIRFLLLLLLLLAGKPAFANMASPYIVGSSPATAFSSRDVDILSENLHIRISADHQSAKYTVEYTVKSDVAGIQIPLLFLAEGYADSFQVWVDGQPVQLASIPRQYTKFAGSPYAAFGAAKDGETDYLSEDQVHISWEKTSGSFYRLRDLKYFQTDLPKGVHKIRVVYTARPWSNRSNWVKSSEFRYSLSPAKHWRSFGSLQITVEQEGLPQTLTGKFGGGAEKWNSPAKTFSFTKLPAEAIWVSSTPAVSALAAFFVALEPFGICLFFVAPLLIFGHLRAIRNYRKAHPQKKFSPVLIWGNLLLPLLGIVLFIASFSFIDWLVGPAAGGMHGYTVLTIFLYPFIMPFYATAMWLADKFWKHRYAQPFPS